MAEGAATQKTRQERAESIGLNLCVHASFEVIEKDFDLFLDLCYGLVYSPTGSSYCFM